MVDYVDAALFNNDSLDKQIHIVSTDSTVNLGNDDLISESFQLIESLCSEENLKFGAVEPRSVKFTVRYNAPKLLNKWLTITMTLEGSHTPFQFGDYKVLSDKPSSDRSKRDVIAYSHYHGILNNTYKSWYKNAWGSSDSMTIKEFRDSFFERLHSKNSWVVQETTTLPNDNAVIKKTKKIPRISGKDILNAICEINGVFGYIGRDNVFHYVRVWNTPHPHEIENDYLISADYEDYVTKAIDRVEILSEDGEVLGDCGEDAGEAENTYTINSNFMLKGLGNGRLAKDTLEYIAENIYQVVSEITYVPMEAEFKGNPCFEIGDEILFHSHGQDIHSFILERTMTGIQSLRDNYVAQGEEVYPEDTNSLSSRISKVQTDVGILDKTKSTNYVGTVDPTSGGGSVDPDLDLSDSNQGDIYIRYKGADEAEISVGSGMQIESETGDANSGYNVTALCIDDTLMEGIYFHYTGLVVGETYTFALENQITTSKPLDNWREHCLAIVCTDYYRVNGNSGWYPGHYWEGAGVLQAGVAYDIEGGFFIPLYYDTNNHSYSHEFVATGTDFYIVVSYTYLMNARYDDNVRGHVKICKLTGTRFGNGKANITHTNIDGNWREITYASEVAQTQGATGGTEIAEITNNDGTKTKVYQKTVTANPQGTASELLEKITIGEQTFNVGGGNVDDVKVDGTSVVTNKIANINTMSGATASAAGTKGLVPAPASGDNEKYLRGDGTWAEVQGGGGSAEMLAPTPFIYSEDEQQVGIWTDGKPLYARTYRNVSITNNADNVVDSSFVNKTLIGYDLEWCGLSNTKSDNQSTVVDTLYVNNNNALIYYVQRTGSWWAGMNNADITVQYTKTTDTPWQGGFKAYGFTPIIYSETEREVGVWTDGKPLYQKTFETSVALASGVWKSTGDSIPNGIGVNAFAVMRGASSDTVPVWCEIGSDGHIELLNIRNVGTVTITHYTIQYTKTTDVAGSGKYAELGVPAVHYDDTERVIGTWFGKPLYQRTFSGLSVLLGADWVNAIDISSLNVSKCIDGVGVASSGYQTPLCTNKNGNYIQVYMNGMSGVTLSELTIKYTKTS